MNGGVLRVMRVREAAALLRIHPLTMYRYLRDGKITARKIGRRYFVTESAIQQFLLGEDDSERV